MREHTRHRVAFDAYVTLGAQRSLERIRDAIAADPAGLGFQRPPGLRTLYRWSAAFRWQERLADLEREARRQAETERLELLVAMNERHAREGLALQEKALRRLQALPEDDFGPGDTIRALKEGVHLERLARGDVTDRIGQAQDEEDDLDLSGFALAELRALAQALVAGAARDLAAEPERRGRLRGGPSHPAGPTDDGAAGPAPDL